MKNYVSFLFCLLLMGCSLHSEKVPCPHAVILAEFSKTMEIQSKVPIRTEMDSLRPVCERRGDDISVNLRLRTTSFRPLTTFNTHLKLRPSFFVAVVDEKGNILSRTNHNLDVTFEEKQTTHVNFVQIQENVPTRKEVAIYVGFNLDETQHNFFQKERLKKLHDNRT